ncbi:heat-inducible transcriptional repressor HrcA [Catenovulum sp. 2E275]|uniref:heat-inducible transcriptional repressor HrcA n=1 Tax=Catenovulum sp. 2E275 TaxID=2980497 RepID=UPI0021D06C4E|nr:heat-inducible transcriptional repressor HrcA [Catenovulum sp. 2E275]MCU4674931.1 heat-inducible transcriptional repressor HrcA [Catenovulum sp. 2E275]
MTNVNLNSRALQVLRVLIEQYLTQGQPVSSKHLAEVESISASSATVRNVMMTLEKAGLLKSPHTSAGRIPTALGLRLFVDELLTAQSFEQFIKQNQLPDFEKVLLQTQLSTAQVCQQASKLLSEVTHLTSLVSVPQQAEQAIEKIEFVHLGAKRLMAIIVLQNGEIQNKVLDLPVAIDSNTLNKMSVLMNMVLSGKTLSQGYKQIKELAKNDAQLNYLTDLTLTAEQHTQANNNHVVVAGQNHLLNENISPQLTKIKAVFEAISEKNLVVDIMQRCRDEKGIKIFIGEETGIETLSECSLISAPYHANGKIVGSLAVIGPTRMDYQKVIPIVDMTSKLLTSALNQLR